MLPKRSKEFEFGWKRYEPAIKQDRTGTSNVIEFDSMSENKATISLMLKCAS